MGTAAPSLDTNIHVKRNAFSVGCHRSARSSFASGQDGSAPARPGFFLASQALKDSAHSRCARTWKPCNSSRLMEPKRGWARTQGVGKVGGGGLMSGVVGVLVRVRRGPAGTMGSA